MKISTWRSWLGAMAIGLAAVLPAQADPVRFEDLAPTLFSGGESVNSGGFNFASDGFGFSGVDTVDGFFFGAPPATASGQFLYMLNDDGIVMTSNQGMGFHLTSFSAAFIAPAPGLGGVLPGHLFVDLYDLAGVLLGTEVFDLATGDVGGDFPFSSLSLANTAGLSAAYFYSCVYQDDGLCSFGGLLPAQFALDNLDATAIPEPGSVLLVLTAMGALWVRRRHIQH